MKNRVEQEPTPGFYSDLTADGLIPVVGRKEAYTLIVRSPGVTLGEVMKALAPLKVKEQDLPKILNPMAEGDGYIKIRRDKGEWRLYPKKPEDPRMPGDLFLRYIG